MLCYDILCDVMLRNEMLCYDMLAYQIFVLLCHALSFRPMAYCIVSPCVGLILKQSSTEHEI